MKSPLMSPARCIHNASIKAAEKEYYKQKDACGLKFKLKMEKEQRKYEKNTAKFYAKMNQEIQEAEERCAVQVESFVKEKCESVEHLRKTMNRDMADIHRKCERAMERAKAELDKAERLK